MVPSQGRLADILFNEGNPIVQSRSAGKWPVRTVTGSKEVERIETARKALRRATRTRRQRRSWVWVLLLVLLVNLVVSMSFVLAADQRLAEIEQRIDLKIQDEGKWRGEVATAQSELVGEVVELRSGLTELRRVVDADEGDLRSVQEVLDDLGGRVGRIESMVTILWSAPSNGARTRGVSVGG